MNSIVLGLIAAAAQVAASYLEHRRPAREGTVSCYVCGKSSPVDESVLCRLGWTSEGLRVYCPDHQLKEKVNA